MVNKQYLSGLLPNVISDLERKNRESLYFNDPVLWARDYLGIRLWDKQGDVARAVVDNKNVAVKAGHEVGKSFLAGLLICWWLDTRLHLPGTARVVSTAPSFPQINIVVWNEVRKFHSLSKRRYAEYKSRVSSGMNLGEYQYCDHEMPGYITSQCEWKLSDGTLVGYGRKPPEGKDDTMQGVHARYVLAIGDESVGLSEQLIQDLANITGNATSRRVTFCNPTNPASYMGRIFKEDTGTWKLMTLSVFDSPNFHGADKCQCEEHINMPGGLGFSDEALEALVDQSYVDDIIRDFGLDSATYISRVLGEFAWDAGPMLISTEELAKALDTEVIEGDFLPILGVDVSRSAKGDMNAVYETVPGVIVGSDSIGQKIRFVDAWNERDAMRTAERIHDLAMSRAAQIVYIDGSGLGGPIADRVRMLANGSYHCWDALGGKPAPGDHRDRFYNVRAWWYSELRRKIAAGLVDIDVEDKTLQEELLSIQTKFPQTGVQKLLIESKEDMRKRGVGSPDYADAAMYSQIDPHENNPWSIDRTPSRTIIELEDCDIEPNYMSGSSMGFGRPL